MFMETTNTAAAETLSTRRYNGKCGGCGAKFSFLAVRMNPLAHTVVAVDGREFPIQQGWGYRANELPQAACRLSHDCPKSRVAIMMAVVGRFVADKKCNAKCLGSTGHLCECSCGGKNHGAKN